MAVAMNALIIPKLTMTCAPGSDSCRRFFSMKFDTKFRDPSLALTRSAISLVRCLWHPGFPTSTSRGCIGMRLPLAVFQKTYLLQSAGPKYNNWWIYAANRIVIHSPSDHRKSGPAQSPYHHSLLNHLPGTHVPCPIQFDSVCWSLRVPHSLIGGTGTFGTEIVRPCGSLTSSGVRRSRMEWKPASFRLPFAPCSLQRTVVGHFDGGMVIYAPCQQ